MRAAGKREESTRRAPGEQEHTVPTDRTPPPNTLSPSPARPHSRGHNKWIYPRWDLCVSRISFQVPPTIDTLHHSRDQHGTSKNQPPPPLCHTHTHANTHTYTHPGVRCARTTSATTLQHLCAIQSRGRLSRSLIRSWPPSSPRCHGLQPALREDILR